MNLNPFLAFWRTIFGNPEKVAYQKLQDAVKRRARQSAEVAYETHMVEFYSAQAHLIEMPITTSYIAYALAHALEKKEEHEADLRVETRRHEDAKARVMACEARLEKLRYPTVSRVAQR